MCRRSKYLEQPISCSRLPQRVPDPRAALPPTSILREMAAIAVHHDWLSRGTSPGFPRVRRCRGSPRLRVWNSSSIPKKPTRNCGSGADYYEATARVLEIMRAGHHQGRSSADHRRRCPGGRRTLRSAHGAYKVHHLAALRRLAAERSLYAFGFGAQTELARRRRIISSNGRGLLMR